MMSKTILIVDDEPHMRRLLQFTLARTGHRLLQATSGEDAIEQARREQLHLLVVDVGLPGKDGFETVRAIKELPAHAHLPVIMLTARGDTSIQDRAGALGVSAFMTKPFSPLELTRQTLHLLASTA